MEQYFFTVATLLLVLVCVRLQQRNMIRKASAVSTGLIYRVVSALTFSVMPRYF